MCTGVCSPWSVQCYDPTSIEQCGQNGQWMIMSCPYMCSGGQCVGPPPIDGGPDGGPMLDGGMDVLPPIDVIGPPMDGPCGPGPGTTGPAGPVMSAGAGGCVLE
jgi:hypothetical protein